MDGSWLKRSGGWELRPVELKENGGVGEWGGGRQAMLATPPPLIKLSLLGVEKSHCCCLLRLGLQVFCVPAPKNRRRCTLGSPEHSTDFLSTESGRGATCLPSEYYVAVSFALAL